MALLSQRQTKAADLARELGKFEGVWITSPLPLDDGAKLRFQVLDGDRNRVLQTLQDWGWEPQFVSVLPRVTFVGFAGACVYEVDLPRERAAVPVDDRTIRGELADRKKSDAEVEAVLRYLGWKK